MKYVVSDIHGDYERFHDILEKIHLQDDDTLFIIGDVIDRGKDGIKLLLEIMEMPNVKMLIGNHEYMMLQALSESIDKWDRFFYLHQWYSNGGQVTHEAFKALSPELQQKVLKFLDRLYVTYTLNAGGRKYTLVHAAPPKMYYSLPRYDVSEYSCVKEFAVWYRLSSDKNLPKGSIYVHGHTPTNHEILFCEEMKIYREPRRINIDCGCGYSCGYHGITGYLACLRLDDGEEFYSFPKND